MQIAFYQSEYCTDSQTKGGGLATYTANMTTALRNAGEDVRIVTRSDIEHKKTGTRLASFIDKRLFPAIYWEKMVSAGLRRFTEELYKKNKLDIIQIPEFNAGACEFAGSCLPCVVRFHTPSYLVDKLNGIRPSFRRKRWYALEGKGIAAASALTASSNAVAREVCSYYKIRHKKVTVLRNPVDSETFFPRNNDTDTEQFRILFCGRLEERKGMGIIENIIPKVLQKAGDIEFLFAGDDTGKDGRTYQSRIISTAGKHNHDIKFTGAIARDALPELYQAASLFIIPSLFDNSPNSLFEAMASGLPCIGSNVGGIDEIISDGNNGLLFDISQPDELVEKIIYLRNNPGYSKKLGAEARKSILENHSFSRCAAAHLAFYNEITGIG
jgi:glycosyltransferase involved in cell wall biosynthesis